MNIGTSIKKGLFVSASVLSAAGLLAVMPLSASAQMMEDRVIRDDAAVESSQEMREGDTAITGDEDTMQMSEDMDMDMDTTEAAEMEDDSFVQTTEMEMEDTGTTYSTPTTTSPTYSNVSDDDDSDTSTTYSSTSPRALW